MTIKVNTTSIGSYEAQRLEPLDSQKKNPYTNTAETSGSDKISISEEGRLKASVLKAAQNSDDIRQDVVDKFKAQIEAGTYKPESKDIATSLVQQELDIWG